MAGRLKTAAMGTSGIVFFVVAAAAPLAATLGAGPVVFGAAGPGAPGMYLLAGVVLLLFASGYAAMSRHVTNAGGFTAYVSSGLGRRAGHASAGVALLAYNCMLVGLFGQFGVFAQDLLGRWGLSVPWQLTAVVALVVVAVLGYLEVNLSARVLGVLMVAEVLVLLVFDAAVLVRGGPDGVNLHAFAPSNVFAGAPGVALLFAFSCFVGFEATTVYGEEAREPRRTVPRATYVAIVLIGLFYTVTMWAIGLAYGSAEVAAKASADPVNFVSAVNTAFVGSLSTDVMAVLVVTSVFAVLLALQNTLTRYLFSLGRAGLLPEPLGRTHPRFQSPHVASVAQSVVTAVVLGLFMVAGADPLTQLYAWLVGLGTLAVLVLQAGAAVAVVGFFRRRGARPGWAALVAPALGALGLAVGIVLAVLNFDVLTGITGGPAALLPWLIPLAAALTVAIAVAAARRGRPVDLTATDAVHPTDAAEPSKERT
ncbi:APC family permease [Pseudonocardia acaciae]|uniref:APC family permease n=1 Tax=Pseudonocardia acaciae TaxID=551276 RepID=UPI001B80CDCE|nr:APC family permease [Pseudonocardia acaciae]